MITKLRMSNKKNAEVYQILREDMQFFKLKPGSRIIEAELMKKMGIKRTPVRIALRRLSDELMVDIFPQCGTYVSKIDLSLIKEITYIRYIVELDICKALCMERADISRLVDSNLRLMEYAVNTNDIVSYNKLDNAFHRQLFSYNGHTLVWDVIFGLLMHYVRILMLDMHLPDSLEDSFKDHKQIVRIIKFGDIESLSDVLCTHYDHSIMKRGEEMERKYREYFVNTMEEQ